VCRSLRERLTTDPLRGNCWDEKGRGAWVVRSGRCRFSSLDSHRARATERLTGQILSSNPQVYGSVRTRIPYIEKKARRHSWGGEDRTPGQKSGRIEFPRKFVRNAGGSFPQAGERYVRAFAELLPTADITDKAGRAELSCSSGSSE